MNLDVVAGVMAATALASSGAAQEAPPTTGPYLLVGQAPNHVMVVATGTRRQTDAGWSATTIVVFDMPGTGQVRVEGETEFDCDQQKRRTQIVHVFPAPDADNPEPRLTTAAAVPWGPLGANEGPTMTFICEGEIDPSLVRSRLSEHVSSWRATY